MSPSLASPDSIPQAERAPAPTTLAGWTVPQGLTQPWLVLAGGIILSGIAVFLGGPVVDGLSLCALAALGIVLARGRFSHPYTWFGIAFLLYALAPKLALALGSSSTFELYSLHSDRISQLEWVALAGFLLGAQPRSGSRADERVVLARDKVLEISAWRHPTFFLLLVSFAVTAVHLGAIMTVGVTSKQEIALSDSPLLGLGAAFNVLLTAYAVLLLRHLIRHRSIPVALIFIVTSWTVLAFLVTGERDLPLRVALTTLLSVTLVRRPMAPRHLLALVVLIVLAVPILGTLKNALIRETTGSAPLAYLIANNEFTTAGRNLADVVHQDDLKGKFRGRTVKWDVLRLVGMGESPTTWFNREFFPSTLRSGGGRGFSLIAEGYVNFGVTGVAAWFFVTGCLARVALTWAHKHITGLVTYVLLPGYLTYVLRADLANFLTPIVRYVIVPVLVVSMLAATVRKSLGTSIPRVSPSLTVP